MHLPGGVLGLFQPPEERLVVLPDTLFHQKGDDLHWDRAGKLLEFGVKAAGERIGEYMAEKRSGTASAVRDAAEAFGGRDDDDDGTDDGPAYDAAAARDEADARADADLRTRPIATFCGLFGSGMSNEQRKKLRAVAGRAFPLFDDLFCVENDDEGVVAWDKLAKKLSVTQLFELNALLDAEQNALYAKVSELVKARKDAAKVAEEAASEDDDEGDDDGE